MLIVALDEGLYTILYSIAYHHQVLSYYIY